MSWELRAFFGVVGLVMVSFAAISLVRNGFGVVAVGVQGGLGAILVVDAVRGRDLRIEGRSARYIWVNWLGLVAFGLGMGVLGILAFTGDFTAVRFGQTISGVCLTFASLGLLGLSVYVYVSQVRPALKHDRRGRDEQPPR